MSIDYSKLRERIREKGLNQKRLASLIGVSEGHFSKKVSGDFVFTQNEIIRMCEILEIEAAEISEYFFAVKVEKTQHNQ